MEENKIHCKNCGEQMDKGCIICPKCKTKVVNIGGIHPGRVRNKWVAFFLCFFGGFWGFHKYYEGKIVAGIFYMITMGIFGIGWFIDIIILLCKPKFYYV